ncbi:VF530 family protein [Coraliomargarita algicola]|uniref:VF530 family protein n=1 Tax=Coraliomargarita algicola TaxID=3092156 RepID=A0ABZ0RMN5_9BACT|nr:VF530 family protein [Coraliomargarita sp. J2-16]WPJ96661.1 VF530 family protein [Coraliomargarita sp. J2-16]
MQQINNPLHGLSLEKILVSLQGFYGWEGLAERLPVRCFMYDPSIKSSLKFLRKTPWARKKLEDLFIYTLEKYGEEEDDTAEPGKEGV